MGHHKPRLMKSLKNHMKSLHHPMSPQPQDTRSRHPHMKNQLIFHLTKLSPLTAPLLLTNPILTSRNHPDSTTSQNLRCQISPTSVIPASMRASGVVADLPRTTSLHLRHRTLLQRQHRRIMSQLLLLLLLLPTQHLNLPIMPLSLPTLPLHQATVPQPRPHQPHHTML